MGLCLKHQRIERFLSSHLFLAAYVSLFYVFPSPGCQVFSVRKHGILFSFLSQLHTVICISYHFIAYKTGEAFRCLSHVCIAKVIFLNLEYYFSVENEIDHCSHPLRLNIKIYKPCSQLNKSSSHVSHNTT